MREHTGNFHPMPKRRQLKERKPSKPRAPKLPPPEEMRGFPERLAQLIKEQDTNATAVAELAGVKPPTVTRAANGEQWEGIGVATGIRLANALGVRFAWLMTGEEPKHSGIAPAIVHGSDLARDVAAQVLAGLRSREPSSAEVSQDKVSGSDDE